MAGSDALKRLGGGRWETRDGRFQIEPQSGTWVIVDTTQTNEFGLPLVRGPFASLGAAKDAIETSRTEGPVESPLAEKIEEVKRRPPEPATVKPARKASSAKPAKASTSAKSAGEAKPAKAPAAGAEPPRSEPAAPPDPAWFRDLTFADRRSAKTLIAKLEALDIDDAEAIAKAEMAGGQPALAQLAIERLLTAALARAKDPAGAAKATIKVILDGEDDELGADWQLVDGHGRRIEALDIVK
jgi:hypothetical protein